MEWIFLALTALCALGEGICFWRGYLLVLKGSRSPKKLQALKLILFCAFFVFWIGWNFARGIR